MKKAYKIVAFVILVAFIAGLVILYKNTLLFNRPANVLSSSDLYNLLQDEKWVLTSVESNGIVNKPGDFRPGLSISKNNSKFHPYTVKLHVCDGYVFLSQSYDSDIYFFNKVDSLDTRFGCTIDAARHTDIVRDNLKSKLYFLQMDDFLVVKLRDSDLVFTFEPDAE